MRNSGSKARIAAIVTIIVAIAGSCLAVRHFGLFGIEARDVPAQYAGIHYASFGKKSFYGDPQDFDSTHASKERVYGGIVSHHLYVGSEIAKFYAGLKRQHPKTVVLIGPNHYTLGDNDVIVSKYPYDTPWGLVEPNMKVIDQLLAGSVVKSDERPFEIEHSISSNVSYIKEAFPDAAIVPIILKRNTPRAKLDRLIYDLNKALPRDALVIASVDFSHHSKEIVSDFHDQKSISAIAAFDYDTLFNLEIDSPPSIYALLKYLDGKGAQKMKYGHTNSALFGANHSSEDVTSYLFAHFTKGEHVATENVSILNFGDMMFDRGVRASIARGTNSFEFLGGVEGNFLKGVDFIVGNLEGPIIETGRASCQSKEVVFQFASTTPRLLYDAHINMVNIANNHSFDCGQKGIESTQKYLTNYGIGLMGGRTLDTSYAIRKVHDKSVVFVGIDQVTEPVPLEGFYPLVQRLKAENDFVVVNMHWGYEYDSLQSKIQEDIAHHLIDSGADAIFGHHPHVIQPVEIYKGKPIFYSLGNLIFDQLTPATNRGIGAGLVLEDASMSVYVFPYTITSSQPKFLPYDDMTSFCDTYLKDVKGRKGCSFEL